MSLNINHRANRAFATVMVLRAGSHLHFALAALGSPADAVAWRRAFVVYGVWIDAALLYFLVVYPRPRGRLARAPWAFVAAAAALSAVVAFGARDAFAPIESVGFRAMGLSASVLFGVAAAALFRAATREPAGLSRTSMLLMSAGFTCVSVQDLVGAFAVGALSSGFASHPVHLALGAVWVAATLFQLALVARHLRERYAQAHLAIGLATLVLALALNLLPIAMAYPVGGVIGAGFSRLLLPVLTAYALLRYQIFDLDLRLRRGFGRSLVPGAFLLLFFVVSEGAERLVSEALGTLFGLAAAVLLLVVLRPLERLADRVSRRVLPVRDPGGLADDEREALYRELVATAWVDGAPGEGERRVLRAARERLRIPEEPATRIEREVAAAR